MAINTDIWFDESQWTLRTDAFGGRRDNSTAEDLEKYPKFYDSKQYGPLFRMRQNNPSHWPQNPTGPYDNSIAYVGIQGKDLPQCNIYAFTDDKDTTDDPFAKQSLFNDCMPFSVAQLWDSNSDIATNYDLGGLKGFDGWRMDSSTIKSNQSYFHWSPNANNDASNYTTRICPIVKFGTKSIILEPIIRCVDDLANWNSSDGSHFTEYTLSQFAALSQEDIDDLYILGGYCRGYDRREPNKYSAAFDANIKRGLIAEFLSEWKFTDFECDGFADNLEHMFSNTTYSCMLPLFGRPNINQAGFVRDSLYDQMFMCSKAAVFCMNDRYTTIKSGTYFGIYLKKGHNNYLKANVLEMFKRAAAAYGLFFMDGAENFNLNNINELSWISEHMYCGLIDENGLTHGDYTNGVMNVTAAAYIWSDSLQTTYDPAVPHPVTPQNDYSYNTQSHSIGDLATLTKRYIIDAANVEQLGTELWNISDDIAQDDPSDPYKNYDAMVVDTFLTNDPIDCIISLRRFPMSIPHAAENLEHVLLGKVSTDVEGYPMNRAAYEYSFERIRIFPKFAGSFLDYEPYTQFELFIPFCGTVKLSPADILGRELWCKLIVDFCTGTCIGYVYSDDLLIESVNGTLAIDIPVTGTETTSLKASLENAIASYDHSKIQARQTTLSIATIGGLFSTVINPAKTGAAIDEANYNSAKNRYALEHQIAPVHTIGSASPLGLWAVDLDCRLIIYYPTGKVIASTEPPDFDLSELNAFAEVQGLATIETGRIGDYSGFLQGTDALLNSITTNTQGYAATDTELQLIQNLINTGIIV